MILYLFIQFVDHASQGGADGDELWSLSHVTKAVDEYGFCHSRPRKWLQNSERNILIGPETESLVVKHFRHVAVADPKFSAKILRNPDLHFQ
jgi:hypothetical protein